MKVFTACLTAILLAGCSVGKIETAPYSVIKAAPEKNIELRAYDTLILATTPMSEKGDENSAFRNLFNYISGENSGSQEIAMTTPVIMDSQTVQHGTKIPMTTPVFMDVESTMPMMSFVLPATYTIDTAPKPTNKSVQLKELKDYTVAAIKFSGFLSDKNVAKHKEILEQWITNENYKTTGNYSTAAYNNPFTTLPMFRRNEVLIPIQKP
ncbi:MAG TPA: heme-binding protein [Alphaproteobacteria bacterium]|nr:heme-binding protein [Alphaproteobacteria bacterium]